MRGGATAAPPSRRTVMISPLIPAIGSQESAGEKLALEVVNTLATRGPVTVISRDGGANRRAIARGVDVDHLLTREDRTPNRADRLRAAARLQPPVSHAVLPSHRDLLTAADLIDLQWEESGLLAPALRRLAPQAQVVVTLHDVLSQRFSRHARSLPSAARRAAWSARAAMARAAERRILRYADDVIVLSEKDRDLLPSPRGRARVHVIPPPIPGELRPPRDTDSSRPPTLLFVGYMARWENQDAVRWFTDEVLPGVRRSRPDARVVVAGGGIPEALAAHLNECGVETPGFVEDLDALYRDCTAVIAPLRLGAGVKFKVVEAMIRGIPTVTTSVGHEGIEPRDGTMVADDPAAFAEATLSLLADVGAADQAARAGASHVADQYGPIAFRRRLFEVYR